MNTNQRNYWVVRLGEANRYAEVCRQRGVIAVGWQELDLDLSPHLGLDQQEFVKAVSPALAAAFPDRPATTVAGWARQMYKFAALVKPGDVVMSPANSEGLKHFGVVRSGYRYDAADAELPFRHRRDVEWVASIDKSAFSDGLRNSSGSIMTVFNVSGHADEIERLLGGVAVAPIAAESASDLREFGLESQLEDFLVENWASIPEFAGYEVYAEDGERVGQQYVTDIGRIDILARSADGKRWLVVELKKGKTSDDVVGQVLRYVGWVKRNEAGSDAEVRGLVIGSHEDERLKYALSTVPFVDSMTYAVSFSLKKSSL